MKRKTLGAVGVAAIASAITALVLLLNGNSAAQLKIIPIYLIVPAQYASAVTLAQESVAISRVMGQPTDVSCIGSRSCTMEAWFRHELGQVFDYTITILAAPKIMNVPPQTVDSCGRFSGPGFYTEAEQAIADAGYRTPSRYFMVVMGAGGWAGHFSPTDHKLDMGLVGDWGGEVLFGTTAQDPCNWTTEPAGGMSHEFAGMLGMYVTDGYSGALWVGDTMTANNKADLLKYSGSWLHPQMARLHTGGGEIEAPPAATLATGASEYCALSGTVTRDTSVFRSGVASMNCAGGAAAAAFFRLIDQVTAANFFGTAATAETIFGRGYMRFDNAPASTVIVAKTNNGITDCVGAKLTTAGKLQLWNLVANTQIGSDSAATLAMDGSAWYRIEIKAVKSAGNAITDCELQLDGVSVASASGLSLGSTGTFIVWYGWVQAPGASKVCYVDDTAVNDATGALNTSWPGDGKVVMLFSISDNARVGWTNAAAGTTNLFDDVNNTPPVGVAAPTTQPAQIQRAAANTTDTYDANLTSYTTAGVAAGDTLNAISILFNIAYGNNFVASEGLRMLSNPVIAEFTTSTDGTAAGAYPTHWSWGWKLSDYSGLVSSTVTVGTSPVLRVRKNTSSASRIQFCDYMGAYVDYTPAAVAAGPFNSQQGSLHTDPFSLQVIPQAVSRASVWQMATVTSLGSTFVTTGGNETVVATPAIGDLIVVCCASSGRTITQIPTITDNNSSGIYTLVAACTTTASVDSGWIFIRTALIPAASSTTFTYAIAGDTGGGLNVLKVVGCSSVGAAAVQQYAAQNNVAAATPAPAFNAIPDQNNAIIGMVINATTGPILSPPANFTELVDVTYATPTFSMETCNRNGLQSTAAVTWGSASGSQFGDIIIELDCDLPIYFPVGRSPF